MSDDELDSLSGDVSYSSDTGYDDETTLTPKGVAIKGRTGRRLFRKRFSSNSEEEPSPSVSDPLSAILQEVKKANSRLDDFSKCLKDVESFIICGNPSPTTLQLMYLHLQRKSRKGCHPKSE